MTFSSQQPFCIYWFKLQFSQFLPPLVKWYSPLILTSAEQTEMKQANNSPGEDGLDSCNIHRTKLDHGFVTRFLDFIHTIFT